MKKTALFISLILCAVFALCGCSKDGPDLSNVPEMLADPMFENGFNLTTQVSSDPTTVPLTYQNTVTGDAQWRMSQWGVLNEAREGYDKTQHDLTLGTETKEGDAYVYSTQSGSKVVKVDPAKGEIELSVNSQKEYGNIPRMDNEDWPHLLIEQPVGDLIFLDQMKNCYMEIEFELLKNEKSELNNSTAQFQWIFSLQNLNSNAGANVYKDYMWFNVTLFDDRYELAPGTGMIDGGKADATGKYIYGPKGEYFLGDQRVEVGKRVHVQVDLLPEMIKAFGQAQEAGALNGSNLSDMGLGSINIGWEVPGMYDIGVKIYKLSLKAEMNV